MFYITKKTSPTGKKLAAIEKKIKAIKRYQNKLSEEYGFSKWRQRHYVVFGGFSCVIFETKPDLKLWKRALDGYMPKMTGEGLKIYEKFSKCEVISKSELNKAVNFEGDLFTSVGFVNNNKAYYGIETGRDWDYTPPKDMKEVTLTKYRTLFPKKKSQNDERNDTIKRKA